MVHYPMYYMVRYSDFHAHDGVRSRRSLAHAYMRMAKYAMYKMVLCLMYIIVPYPMYMIVR